VTLTRVSHFAGVAAVLPQWQYARDHCGPILRYQLLLPVHQLQCLSAAAAVAFVLAIVSGTLVLLRLLLPLPLLLPLQHLNDSRWSCQSHG